MITHDVDEAILLADRILLMSNGRETRAAGYVPGGIAETVRNPLPRDAQHAPACTTCDGYYALRNHIVDFLVTRAPSAGVTPIPTTRNPTQEQPHEPQRRHREDHHRQGRQGPEVGRRGQRRSASRKEWTTAACLGQMTLNAEQAGVVGEIFGLTAEEQKWLQVVPYKGSLPTAVPTDPLIYRLYEIVSVYGTHLQGTDPRGVRRRHHERDRLQDGHHSARPIPKGDRVNIVLSGKFLPYKTY